MDKNVQKVDLDEIRLAREALNKELGISTPEPEVKKKKEEKQPPSNYEENSEIAEENDDISPDVVQEDDPEQDDEQIDDEKLAEELEELSSLLNIDDYDHLSNINFDEDDDENSEEYDDDDLEESDGDYEEEQDDDEIDFSVYDNFAPFEVNKEIRSNKPVQKKVKQTEEEKSEAKEESKLIKPKSVEEALSNINSVEDLLNMDLDSIEFNDDEPTLEDDSEDEVETYDEDEINVSEEETDDYKPNYEDELNEKTDDDNISKPVNENKVTSSNSNNAVANNNSQSLSSVSSNNESLTEEDNELLSLLSEIGNFDNTEEILSDFSDYSEPEEEEPVAQPTYSNSSFDLGNYSSSVNNNSVSNTVNNSSNISNTAPLFTDNAQNSSQSNVSNNVQNNNASAGNNSTFNVPVFSNPYLDNQKNNANLENTSINVDRGVPENTSSVNNNQTAPIIAPPQPAMQPANYSMEDELSDDVDDANLAEEDNEEKLPNNAYKKIDDHKFIDIIKSNEFMESNESTGIYGIDENNNVFCRSFKDLYNMIVFSESDEEVFKLFSSIMMSYTLKNSNYLMKFVICDAKKESKFDVFNDISYLFFSRIAKTNSDIIDSLSELVNEIEKRYENLAKASVKNIEEFNEVMKKAKIAPMSYIMLFFNNYTRAINFDDNDDIDTKLSYILKYGRLVGIYVNLVSFDEEIEDKINYNLQTRISFKADSKEISEKRISESGAERIAYDYEFVCKELYDDSVVHLKVPSITQRDVELLIKNIEN